MIKRKPKICKGTASAKKYGCSQLKFIHQYGLCASCYVNWLYATPEGSVKLNKVTTRAKKQVKEDNRPKRKNIKWVDKPTHEMAIYIQENIVNPYIRARDLEHDYRCISSNGVIEHAGHCFSVGSTPGLRFNIMNIHGQSHSANVHKHGDFENYRLGLINRFGLAYFKEISCLKIKADRRKNLDRDEIIRIGKTYEYLTKKKLWCFNHEEFENYKNIINK